MPRVPSQAELASQTDDVLAFLAGSRCELTGDDGRFTAKTADATARILRSEFPSVPELGRILVAASGALLSLRGSLARRGVEADADDLLTIAMLAGEQLDRESREGGGTGRPGLGRRVAGRVLGVDLREARDDG